MKEEGRISSIEDFIRPHPTTDTRQPHHAQLSQRSSEYTEFDRGEDEDIEMRSSTDTDSDEKRRPLLEKAAPTSTDQTTRKIYSNDFSKNQTEFQYPDNYISTAKYTVWNFVFKNLFEQFQRVANVYFLIISILQLIDDLSPTGKYTTITPLTIVLTVTAIKDAYEDYKRHQSDKEVNNRMANIIRDGCEMTVTWAGIQTGDIVFLRKGDLVPADLVLISSSEPSGSCYIETSSLDGETNLKIRKAVPVTMEMRSSEQMMALNVTVECEAPNNRLYHFEGSMEISGDCVPVSDENIMLRGVSLRNTRWIYGLAVYTGVDSKLAKNSSAAPHKKSKVERLTNIQIGFIFLLLFVLCIICAIGLGIWSSQNSDGSWYLHLSSNSGVQSVLGFFTFLILFNNLIPISLYVSMEMVKVIQAFFITNDIEMYHEPSDTTAVARTSSLNEELGQIEFVFSDKTGTLTENRLEFLKCSIGKECYGEGTTEIGLAVAKREGRMIVDTRPPDHLERYGMAFFDSRLVDGKWKEQENWKEILEFLVMLAVCHSVVPEEGMSASRDDITYQASSPDDEALVMFARRLGVFFCQRTPTHVHVRINGEDREFRLLNVLEFTSDRKRMSVIVKHPDGKIVLYCKGADSVILERLAKDQEHLDCTMSYLEGFAGDGLRTLCCAKSELEEKVWSEWNARYERAMLAIENRTELLEEVAEEIEHDLVLIGATAIEDKLQQGVPDTIAQLAEAGIRTWVLTGDKRETAINIGFACALLDNTMNTISLRSETHSGLEFEIEEKKRELNESLSRGQSCGLVVEGRVLGVALEECPSKFLELAEKCRSVICCRVSPLQKALVVRLVRTERKHVTLAVGDGANDVSMIQAAHVGIGISGVEGLQAARAADYSIAQFRFLRKLLLVHGRWNYRRTSKLIMYSFYKNMTMFFTQFWFVFLNGFSGQTLYEKWTLSMYNVLFTAFPVLAMAVFDRDISSRAAMKFPKLYYQGRKNKLFLPRVFWGYVLNAIFHSAICFWIPYFSLRETNWSSDGRGAGLWQHGLVVYTGVIFTVTLKLALETSTWTRWNHVTTWGSILIWFVYLSIYSSLYSFMAFSDFSTLYFTFFEVFISPRYWLVIILVPVMALMRDVIFKYYKRNVRGKGDRGLFYTVQRLFRGGSFDDMAPSTIDAVQHPNSEIQKTILFTANGEHEKRMHKGTRFPFTKFEFI
eukprot:TRINITY_DN933_c0_g1_i3.p1 TRINITY_DN933_c0_g1~~TRINITY_DN933_c0_g1_i3.p1  ORF type:complete len:1250 (+),score=273.44 TRINITY_DN933_c0_g1_i3:141-3752(+)